VKRPRFRFSRTVVLIMGSIVVFGGGSGAAAVIIGADKILGPSYREINGLECTDLETIKIKRDQQYWVRKYVTSDQTGDGLTRVRTALRVAQTVQKKEKADLVQVAMIDEAGPKDRAQMRGRTIGAQVVYIPDVKKMPEGTKAQTYSAYYLDGSANSNGEYYGMRIDLPLEDVETLSARLTDNTDCVDPKAEAAAAEYGVPITGDDEAAGHGGHGTPGENPDDGDKVASAESGGFVSSVTGMIFGSQQETPAGASEGEGHTAAPAESRDASADGHDDAAAVEDHGDQSAPAEQAAVAPKEEEGGFLTSVKGMIFGNGGNAKPGPSPSADAQQAPEASLPSQEPRTAVEGGKRWSKGTEADEIRSDHVSSEASQADAAPLPTDGSTAADAAGAAWLAKFRNQSPAMSVDKPQEPAKD